eukprot:9726324-Karenia_brevis.AAC.1
MAAACKIQHFEDCGDTAKSYKIVRSLAGKPPKPLLGLRAEDESLLTDKEEIAERWLQHYSKVLAALVTDKVEDF